MHIPLFRFVALLVLTGLVASAAKQSPAWETVTTHGAPHPRHEAAFVECDGKFYLLGGRRIQPVDIYDPVTNRWSEGAPPPMEIHHFQPVVWRGLIVLAGAMTGGYPHETALPRVVIYDPAKDVWSEGAEIPEDRRRGGAGAVVIGDQLYLVAGIINGHWDGHVAWLDRLDLATGTWVRLADAPHQRDHFQASYLDGKIYAGGGRRSSAKTGETFSLVEPALDIFDLATETWSTAAAELPDARAGTFSLAVNGRYLVAGGESHTQKAAFDRVDAYDPLAEAWETWPRFVRGRHGAGLIQYGGALYTCSGSGNRGGSPELDSLEVLPLAR